MMESLLTENEVQLLRSTLDGARKIVVTCHTNPDGDALGSMTAVMSVLKRHGHEVLGVAPDKWPDNLKWLPLVNEVKMYAKHEAEVEEAIKDADLILMVDHGRLDRMSELGNLIGRMNTPRVVLDHHPEPEDGPVLALSCPQLCAASEVVYRVFNQLGWMDDMTHDEAVSIYTGMMTDTGGFTFNSSRPEVFLIISHLLERGIDKDRLYRNVYYTASVDRYRLLGYLLYVKMEVLHEYHTAIMSFTNEERRHFQLKNGETDGMVNQPLMIDGMKLSIFLREDTEKRGVVRLSLRSVDDFPCNEMSAEFFNGGGHRNASGGRLECSMDEAIEIVKNAVRKYGDKLRTN